MADAGEQAALTVISAHLRVPVRVHDDQLRPGMHDLEISFPDGRRGAVEVTAAEDERLAGDFGALHKRPVLREQRLSRGWLVSLLPNANVRLARARLPDLLVDVERAGLDEVSVQHVGSWEQYEEQSHLRELLAEAHVSRVRAGSMKPGHIGILPAPRVSWMSSEPEDVVAFVERFATARPSDVAKLGRSGADERHLFIWGGVFSTDWHTSRALGLDIDRLPQRPPALPSEVTHVWVAADQQHDDDELLRLLRTWGLPVKLPTHLVIDLAVVRRVLLELQAVARQVLASRDGDEAAERAACVLVAGATDYEPPSTSQARSWLQDMLNRGPSRCTCASGRTTTQRCHVRCRPSTTP